MPAPHAGIDNAPASNPADSPTAEARRLPIAIKDEYDITPFARQIAAARGIDLSVMRGSGPAGRIRAEDLLPRAAAPASAAMPDEAEVWIGAPGSPPEPITRSATGGTIAGRRTESRQGVPHFCLTVRCRLDALLGLRTELNAGLATRGVKLSVNDLMIKVLAGALADVPDAHVQLDGEDLHRLTRADIAVVVAGAAGLATPVIRDVGALSMTRVARVVRAFVERAREGKLTAEDCRGGTASLANIGMYGVDEMIPVINPPWTLILGIGAGIEQPWKVDDGIALATIVACTASFDHRAIDGETAAQFMTALRDLIETPLRVID